MFAKIKAGWVLKSEVFAKLQSLVKSRDHGTIELHGYEVVRLCARDSHLALFASMIDTGLLSFISSHLSFVPYLVPRLRSVSDDQQGSWSSYFPPPSSLSYIS